MKISEYIGYKPESIRWGLSKLRKRNLVKSEASGRVKIFLLTPEGRMVAENIERELMGKL